MASIRRLAVLALCGALIGCTLTGCSIARGGGSGQTSPQPSARAGFGGPSTAPSAVVTEVDKAAFRTPSRNIVCALSKSSVRCDITRKTWQPPAKPANCDLDWGNGLFLEAGKAGVTCAGDTLTGSATQTLEYGKALRSGDVLCTSESTGLTCKDQKSGGGFTLAAARYSIF